MTLDIAFLGYRFMGQAHANALARLPMFFPEAPATNRHTLVGQDEAALADAADRLGFDRTATEWETAIADADVLYNLGPNFLHAEPAITALEQGTHVLCEKPLARTTDEAERMAAAAADSDAVAGTAFNYRYLPAIQYAKNLIDAGELGEIRHVRGRYLQDWLTDPEAPWSWRLDAELAGSGALGDLGAHTVDLVQFLTDDIAKLSGQTRTFVDERPTEDGGLADVTVDDAYTAHGELETGATVTLEASRFATGHKNDHTLEIEGSKGALAFSLERLNELELKLEDDRGFQTVLVTDEDDPYIDHWWPPGHTIGWEHTFVHQSATFLDAVAGDGDYTPDFDDGLGVQRVLGAIQESDERGERVSL